MSAPDPYQALGLTSAASPAAIKSAYRKKVQATHPDRGGDPEAFIAIVRAFDLLSDPESRRLFDETGIVDEAGVKAFRHDVVAILADMFDAAVSAAVATAMRLDRVDFITQMRGAVVTGMDEARALLSRTSAEIETLDQLRTRIRRKTDGENVFAARLETQIEARLIQQARIRRRLLILDTALVELGNYASEVELIAALDAES